MNRKLPSILALSIAVGLAAPAMAGPMPGASVDAVTSRPAKQACKPDKAAGSVWRPNAKCDKARPGVSTTGFGAGVGAGADGAAATAATTAVYVGFGIFAATALFALSDRRDAKPISQ